MRKTPFSPFLLLAASLLMAACGDDDKPAPPSTFRVGGTVSGLSGRITLQLNELEQLPRDADGPFSFETRLADGGRYAVTVATPPPEQDCTVENATGTVAGADVDSVRVSCVTRTYSLGGTVAGLDGTLELSLGGETLRLTANGPFTFATKLPKGGTYTVGVATQPASQRCAVSQGSGTVAGNVEDVSVRCVYWYTLDNFQAARVVLGQADFVGKEPNRDEGPAGADTLDGPWGNPAFAGGRLYVTDQNSNRVLGFTGVPTANGASADFVLGQTDFAGTASGSGQAGLLSPEALSSDGSRLTVADTGRNRVLLHTALPASTGALPALVVGQPDFTSTGNDCDAKTLAGPEDAVLGQGKLVVADSGHNRVLVWNTLPTTNGAPADLVLGQGSLTTCAENDANGDGVKDATPSATSMWSPTGVWTDGQRLVVVDFANNRVLLWTRFPTRNGQPADVVLGQVDFTSRVMATSATGLRAPYYVASTGLQLFVVDNQNNRVLAWNQFPTANGAPADLVLGQADFTSARMADPDTSAPSARSLDGPSGLLLAWPHVVVPDFGDNRVLVFESR